MLNVDFLANRVVVLAAALVYWVGVFVQTRRVRRMIGRQPNVKPRGTKENFLWIGWFLVVAAWLTLPFAARSSHALAGFQFYGPFLNGLTFWAGIVFTIAGYGGTLWCYAVMGNTWRMGINRAEKTPLITVGPFHYVRHPIYLFQVLMLVATALLLPTPISLLALVLHVACIFFKVADEEDYLRAVHGEKWVEYLSRTGRFFPKFRLFS